jgi:hypothetical protein
MSVSARVGPMLTMFRIMLAHSRYLMHCTGRGEARRQFSAQCHAQVTLV